MNHSQDFSEFVTGIKDIIDNGHAEAEAPEASLERMRLTAIRQGKRDEAAQIGEFLRVMDKEITFFRKTADIVSANAKRGWADWFPILKKQITPYSFEKVEQSLSPQRPFQCYEGMFRHQDSKGHDLSAANLKGPFLLAVAANFSGAIDLPKGALVCLFTQSNKLEKDKPIELRIWGAPHFTPLFEGKCFDQSFLVAPPDSNETIIETHKTSPRTAFKLAVERMARASLSRNPPKDVAEQWLNLLNDYAGSAPEPLAIR